MGNDFPPDVLRVATARTLLVVATLVFAVLAADLVLHGPLTGSDASSVAWLHGRSSTAATALLTVLSRMHGTIGIDSMAAALAAVLLFTGRRRWVPLLLAAVPGGLLFNAALKSVFDRARPDLVHGPLALSSPSFPSGHAAGATVWWGFILLLYVAHQQRPGLRCAMATLAGSMVLLTAVSRVFLGYHFPTDVVAGVAEGMAWLMLLVLAFGAAAARRSPEVGS